MAPRKKTAAKKAPASRARKKTTAKRTRVAAKAHSAASHHVHDPHHTYTDHRSDSYKHYASIMKTVILFLGFVLLLAIIANIFAPSLGNRPITNTASASGGSSAQNFLDTSASGYKAAHPYKYALPEGTSASDAAKAATDAAKAAIQQ